MDERAEEDAGRQCRMRVWPVVYLHECLELFGEIAACGCGHTDDATALSRRLDRPSRRHRRADAFESTVKTSSNDKRFGQELPFSFSYPSLPFRRYDVDVVLLRTT